MLRKFLVVFVALQVSGKLTHPPEENEEVSNFIQSEKPAGINYFKLEDYLNGFQVIQRFYNDCSKDDITTCLKIKLVGVMDKIVRSKHEVNIIDGVSFVRDNSVEAEESLSHLKIEAMLPRSYKEKDNTLNELIMDKFLGFFKTHKLQLKLPSFLSNESTNANEARGRRKRSGLLMVPLIIAGTLVPMALGGLALFAGKALLVSKLALVLAIIIGLRKLLGTGESDKSHEVYISPGHDSGHSRAYHLQDAHKLVYKGYIKT